MSESITKEELAQVVNRLLNSPKPKPWPPFHPSLSPIISQPNCRCVSDMFSVKWIMSKFGPDLNLSASGSISILPLTADD